MGLLGLVVAELAVGVGEVQRKEVGAPVRHQGSRSSSGGSCAWVRYGTAKEHNDQKRMKRAAACKPQQAGQGRRAAEGATRCDIKWRLQIYMLDVSSTDYRMHSTHRGDAGRVLYRRHERAVVQQQYSAAAQQGTACTQACSCPVGEHEDG